MTPDVSHARGRKRIKRQCKEVWRNDDEGKLDDVCVPHVETFRMERMDANYWWLCLYMADGRAIHVDLVADQAGIVATKRED